MTVTLGALNGAYKTRYGEMQKLVPEWSVCQGLFPFETRKQLGKDFREQIFLKRSLGVLFQGGSSLGALGTYPTPISLQSEEAVITPNEITLREQMSYGAIMAALNAGPAAFGNMLDEVILGLDDSHRFFVECAMLYGGTSIGTISVVTADTSTTKVLTISAATWAPGIWAQFEGGSMDVYDSAGTTLINTNALLTFTKYNDVDNRKILVTGNSTDVGNLAAGQLLVFRGVAGATPGAAVQIMNGIDAIVTNTGTMFGISASTYGLWKGNTYAISGALTMSGIHTATSRVVSRGGYGRIVYLLSPFAWQDICDDQSALRRYTENTKTEMVNGSNSLKFYGTNGDVMELMPHPMVKNGEAFGLMTEHWVRAGVSDLTNRLPGHGEEDFFLQIPDKPGCEVRNYSSQFIYSRKPAKNIKITGIVPRSAP